jgi:hypothetical protein
MNRAATHRDKAKKNVLLFFMLALFACNPKKTYLMQFHDFKEEDMEWFFEVDSPTPCLIVRNDTIAVRVGTQLRLVSSENGNIYGILSKSNGFDKTSWMIVNHGRCQNERHKTLCQVELTDRSVVKTLAYIIDNLNSRLTYPSFSLEFKNNEDLNLTLDFQRGHLEIYDVMQLSARKFVLLYGHTPHVIGEFGKKKVGLLNIDKFISAEGNNFFKKLLKDVK